jgi:CGNR zinc finger
VDKIRAIAYAVDSALYANMSRNQPHRVGAWWRRHGVPDAGAWLREIVDLVQTDLSTLNSQKIRRLWRRVANVLVLPSGQTPPQPAPHLDTRSVDELAHWQQLGRDMLRATATASSLRKDFSLRIRVSIERGHPAIVTTSPDVRDLWIYQLAVLLGQVDRRRIRLCQAPDCDRVFVKVTKKAYCSRRCQSRHYMQQVRAQDKEMD